MTNLSPVSDRYLGSDYLHNNPTWDGEDSPWKAARVAEILHENNISPRSLVDIGCGAGLILLELQKKFPSTRFSGFDIAPAAEQFWAAPRSNGISLQVADFLEMEIGNFDVALVLDVVEHLQDPFSFLARLNGRARYYVFHFPLDLSAINVLRESPLLHVRQKVGHVHYYTKNLALSLLLECGFSIIDARFTGAAFTSPQRTLKTWMASLPRRIARLVNKDWAARLLGGETLMVLARAGN